MVKKIDTRAPLETVTESSLDLSRKIQQITITPQAYLRGTLYELLKKDKNKKKVGAGVIVSAH
jgi:transcription termination factor NusB